jgi:acetyl esterase
VITAHFDPLRDEGDAYAQALEKAGVKVTHLPNPTMIHGFFWMKGVIGHTSSVYAKIGQQLKGAFASA